MLPARRAVIAETVQEMIERSYTLGPAELGKWFLRGQRARILNRRVTEFQAHKPVFWTRRDRVGMQQNARRPLLHALAPSMGWTWHRPTSVRYQPEVSNRSLVPRRAVAVTLATESYLSCPHDANRNRSADSPLLECPAFILMSGPWSKRLEPDDPSAFGGCRRHSNSRSRNLVRNDAEGPLRS